MSSSPAETFKDYPLTVSIGHGILVSQYGMPRGIFLLEAEARQRPAPGLRDPTIDPSAARYGETGFRVLRGELPQGEEHVLQ